LSPTSIYDPEQVAAICQLQHDALLYLQRLPPDTRRELSAFTGKTDDEIAASLLQAVREGRRSAVLSLLACIEAAFRRDMERRRGRRQGVKRKLLIASGLRALYRKSKDRVRLDDILDVWRDSAGNGKSPFGKLKQMFEHRHWLAHGRYWTDKSGVQPDPEDVLDVWLEVRQIAVTAAPDFPILTL